MQRDLLDGQRKNFAMSSHETSTEHETENDQEQDLMTPTSEAPLNEKACNTRGTSGSTCGVEASASRGAEASASRGAEASASRGAEASASRGAEASASRDDLVSSNSSSVQDNPINTRECCNLEITDAQLKANFSLQLQTKFSQTMSYLDHVVEMELYFCSFLESFYSSCYSIDHACPRTPQHRSHLRSRGAHNRTSLPPPNTTCGSKRQKRSKKKKRAKDPDQTSSEYQVLRANIMIRQLHRSRNVSFQRVCQLFRSLVMRFQIEEDKVEELYYLFSLYLMIKKLRFGFLPECSLRWSLLLRGYPDLAVLCSAILPRYYYITALPSDFTPSNFTYPKYENGQFVRTLFSYNDRDALHPWGAYELLENGSPSETHSSRFIAWAIRGAIQIRSNLQIAASNHRNQVGRNYASYEPLRLRDLTRSGLSENVSHSQHRRLIQRSNSAHRSPSGVNTGSRSRSVSRSRNIERSRGFPVSRSLNRNVIVQEEASSQARSNRARIPCLLRWVQGQPTSAANIPTNQNGQNRRYILQSLTPVFRSSNNSLAHSSSSQNRASYQVIDVQRIRHRILYMYFDSADALRRFRHGVSRDYGYPETFRRCYNSSFTMDYESA